MKLWIDDIRNAPDDSWTVARTVTAAIRAIYRFDFEVISLDHDISHYENLDDMDTEQNVYACQETFMAVVYFLAEKYWHDKPMIDSALHVGRLNLAPKIILHTSNQVAGDEMAAVLKDVGIESEKKYMGAANRLEMEV